MEILFLTLLSWQKKFGRAIGKGVRKGNIKISKVQMHTSHGTTVLGLYPKYTLIHTHTCNKNVQIIPCNSTFNSKKLKKKSINGDQLNKRWYIQSEIFCSYKGNYINFMNSYKITYKIYIKGKRTKRVVIDYVTLLHKVNQKKALAWWLSCLKHLPHTAKVCGFNFWSQHIPRLQVQSPV